MKSWRTGRVWAQPGPEAAFLAGLLVAYFLPQRTAEAWAFKQVALGVALAFSCAAAITIRLQDRFSAGVPSAAHMLGFALWSVLGVAWSLDPERGLGQALILAWSAGLVVLARGSLTPEAVGIGILCVACMELFAGWIGFTRALTGSAPEATERVHGSFVNANHHAALLCAGYAVAACRGLLARGPARPVYVALALMLLAGACWSGTRALLLAVPATIVVTGLALRRERGGAILTVLTVLSLALLLSPRSPGMRMAAQLAGEKDEFSWKRADIWIAGGRILRRAPLAGAGTGSFADAFRTERSPEFARYEAAYAHSEPVHLAAEGGVIGLGLLVWLAFGAGVSLVRSVKARPARAPAAAAVVALACFALVGFPLRVPILALCCLGALLSVLPPWRASGAERKRYHRLRYAAALVPLIPAVWLVTWGLAELRHVRGTRLLRQGKSAQAADAFESALRAFPLHSSSLHGLAEIGSSREKAAERYALASRLRPAWIAPLVGLFRLAIDDSDPKRAAALLERARNVDPESLEIRLMETSLFMYQGNLERARKNLEKVERTWPDQLDVLLMRAEVEAGAGNRENARKIVRRVLSHYPRHQHAMKMLEDLE